MSTKRRLVVAVVANVKQFRHVLYQRLHARLLHDDIDLKVYYSAPGRLEATKQDSCDLPTLLGKRVRRIYCCRDRMLLQFPPLQDLARADLVIVVQANGYLLNYPLLLLAALGLKRVALWGHGRNRQGRSESLSEYLKRRLALTPTWWFAYTSQTATYLRSIGFAADRITCIDNAIDTDAFRMAVQAVSPEALAEFRARFRLTSSDVVGLYCGSLYAEKNLAMLIAAADILSRQRPAFRLLIVGAGPDAQWLAKAAESRSYLRLAGALFGDDKAISFRLATVLLNPGLVGLGILDAFAAGLPFITTQAARHSPEIEYLEAGNNGLIIDGDAEAFAAAAKSLLDDEPRRNALSAGAQATASRFTIDNMVANIARGIDACLTFDGTPQQ